MPWDIIQDDSRCPLSKPWAVVKEADGELAGCHETSARAAGHIAALEAPEAGKMDKKTIEETLQLVQDNGGKFSQDDASYISPSTHDGQECGSCAFYNSAAETCQVVAGAIMPTGVSNFFIARQEEEAKVDSEAKAHKVFSLPDSTKVIDGDQGIVEHLVTVFGVFDDGSDISHPGSFAKTLSERGGKVRVVDSHNYDSVLRVVGKPLMIKEIAKEHLPPSILAKYPEATGGLWARTQFLMNTPEGQGAFERIKEGAIDEWSYGYDPMQVDFSDIEINGASRTARNLRQLRLWEYGPVLWGMNPATTVMSVKGVVGKAVDLSQQVEDIRIAFNSQYKTPNGPWPYWVNAVFDEFVLITHESDSGVQNFQVGYSQDEDSEINFAPRAEWIEGDYEFTPKSAVPNKAGRVLSAGNANELVNAVAAIAAVLERAGIDVPGFGDAPAPDEQERGEPKQTAPDESQAAKEQGEPRAGPCKSTPTNSDEKLLRLIEIEQAELQLLEV